MLDPADMYGWMLALFRASALMFSVPVFEHSGLPRTVKVAFAGLLAWIVLPEHGQGVPLPASGLAVGLVAAKEIVIGATMGFAVRMVFAVLDFAARVLAVEIGMHPPPEFNSTSNVAGNPVSTTIYYLGIVVFLSGAHYAMIVAFVRSLELVPPGLQAPDLGFVSLFVQQTSAIVKLGVLMAAPFIAVNFLVNLTFSLLGRVVPRMNVFVLSFSVRIFAGLAMLAVSGGLITHYIIQEFRDTPEMMLRFLPFAVR